MPRKCSSSAHAQQSNTSAKLFQLFSKTPRFVFVLITVENLLQLNLYIIPDFWGKRKVHFIKNFRYSEIRMTPIPIIVASQIICQASYIPRYRALYARIEELPETTYTCLDLDLSV